METTAKVVCPVCSGKGGFKKPKRDFLDEGWTDCLYCEGFGFIEDTLAEDNVKNLLLLENYRAKIKSELSTIGDIQILSTDELGKDLYIQIVPTNKKVWIPFLKTLTKFSAYSESFDAVPKQVFFYNTLDDSHHYYLEIHILTDSLRALDGFIELIQLFNSNQE